MKVLKTNQNYLLSKELWLLRKVKVILVMLNCQIFRLGIFVVRVVKRQFFQVIVKVVFKKKILFKW